MELWELNNSLNESLIFKPYKEAKEILENNGFKVIRPFDVKEEYLKIIKDSLTANEFHLFSPYGNTENENLNNIYKEFDKIVLKDTRKNSSSFETLNGYLNYRSGCFYKWFYPNGEPKI